MLKTFWVKTYIGLRKLLTRVIEIHCEYIGFNLYLTASHSLKVFKVFKLKQGQVAVWLRWLGVNMSQNDAFLRSMICYQENWSAHKTDILYVSNFSSTLSLIFLHVDKINNLDVTKLNAETHCKPSKTLTKAPYLSFFYSVYCIDGHLFHVSYAQE